MIHLQWNKPGEEGEWLLVSLHLPQMSVLFIKDAGVGKKGWRVLTITLTKSEIAFPHMPNSSLFSLTEAFREISFCHSIP